MSAPHQSSKGLPASYRIALALSVALLAHTLVLSGLPFPRPEAPPQHHRLTFELRSSASSQSTASQPAAPANTVPTMESGERNPPFEIPEHTPETPADPVLSKSSPQALPEPSEEAGKPAPRTARPEPARHNTTRPEPHSSTSEASTPVRAERETEQAQQTLITESPTQQDPYVIRLASHLARELEQLRIPAIAQLRHTARMEIELQLMKNGALTRARLLKATGIANVDEAAYRAALAASPYPEPPEESENGARFEVELVFSPKRL